MASIEMTLTISVRRRWFEPAVRWPLFVAVWLGAVDLDRASRFLVATCWRIEAR